MEERTVWYIRGPGQATENSAGRAGPYKTSTEAITAGLELEAEGKLLENLWVIVADWDERDVA